MTVHHDSRPQTSGTDGTAAAAQPAARDRMEVRGRNGTPGRDRTVEDRPAVVALPGRDGPGLETCPVEKGQRPARKLKGRKPRNRFLPEAYRHAVALGIEDERSARLLLELVRVLRQRRHDLARRLVRRQAAVHVQEGFRADQAYCDRCQVGDGFTALVVAALRRSGLRLRGEGDTLWVGPAEKMTPALREQIRTHRTAILAVLDDEEKSHD